ncbi:hypothetical protein IWQ56_005375, partial [Coemansia nantahalensis]
MEMRFQPLCDLLFPSVMKTCGRANKVFITRGVNCLTTVITYAHIPEQTPNICSAAASDPSKTVRTSASKLLMSIVSCCTVPELTPHLPAVEKAIADGIVDANPEARTTARQSYEIYIKRFSDRVEQFHASLSATAKKYLKISDKSADSTRSAPNQLAAVRQRQPLRDRIAAQRAGAKPAATGAGDGPGAAVPGPQRPKPVRPIARPGPMAVRKADASAAAVAVPLALDVDTAEAEKAPAEPLAMGPKSRSLDSVLMSPSGAKPALPRMLSDDATVVATSAPDAEQAAVSPHDSGHASASPTASHPESRATSPGATAKASGTTSQAVVSSKTTPAQSGDEDSTKPAPTGTGAPKPAAASRAKRGPGLSFSSLGSSASRAAHGARAQPRSMVSSRVEEALRAQRPVSRATAGDGERRMTLRSDTRRESLGPCVRAAPASTSTGPGYLRATASSAQRVAGSAAAARGTKRRRRADGAEDDTTQAPPKAAKVGA